jgi:regulator of protease activity HflC (stomatin/prohibitin superfamily)
VADVEADQATLSGAQATVLSTAVGLLLLLCSLRSVPLGERMVVVRRGRARLRGPGVVALLPFLDRGVRVPLGVRWYGVDRLEATTRDAVRVAVTAAATGTVQDPLRYATASNPDQAVEWVLESELRRRLAERDLAQLATAPLTGATELAAAVSARTAEWGVEIGDVQLGRVETRVDPSLVRWATSR